MTAASLTASEMKGIDTNWTLMKDEGAMRIAGIGEFFQTVDKAVCGVRVPVKGTTTGGWLFTNRWCAAINMSSSHPMRSICSGTALCSS